MTRRRVVLGASLGVVAYVVVLVGGGVLVGAVAAATRALPPMGWLTVVPPLLAGVLAPLVARAGRGARPWAGVLVAGPAAIAAAAITWWGTVLAAQHGGPPAGDRALDAVVQALAVLVVAVVTVLVLRSRTGHGPPSDAD
ncbi:hypothetical protein [Cellulomonas dongxiuzhuiae]|uniref:Uncharacterized protein n=1 Tax=Cellulomonas dongxiuzhuiae TaxID=2819979 RepID=A0ABX8GHP4_9CELL|nr:hypothetical protein [Cellulomonas dongxiuzhuiae]MBO3094112.1 hypothetical protein [Cellulomonas dongxiuzhuiae]QWC15176.1 hypothetical protein KKR89_12685 [Cellulomonas dongxiuzhuiae]